MTFTDTLWDATRGLQDDIAQMPFNRELAAGTLPREVFQGYIIQDAHYLEGFARALALAAAKGRIATDVATLAGSAAGAIAVERELHAHYMQAFGISADQFAATEVSQACDHYVAFLIRRTGFGSFAEGIAALLPCFWVYREIGRQIAAEAAADTPYAAWIETYSGAEFDAAVEAMLALVDREGDRADATEAARMHAAFARSTWHEWHFWDSAYHRRGWPSP